MNHLRELTPKEVKQNLWERDILSRKKGSLKSEQDNERLELLFLLVKASDEGWNKKWGFYKDLRNGLFFKQMAGLSERYYLCPCEVASEKLEEESQRLCG